MASAAASCPSEEDVSRCMLHLVYCLMVATAICLIVAAVIIDHAKPTKTPEFSITSMNVTSLPDSNSSAAITVDVQVLNPEPGLMYHSMHVYLVKDGWIVGEVSVPASGLMYAERIAVKVRLVVVGARDWDAPSDRGRVSHFDVWASADVDMGYEKELKVTCEGVGVGFGKGATVGFMVDAVRNCTTKVD